MSELTSLTLPAPAKLNLFLHINFRRPDGYHELQTLFQLLDHGDQLTFTYQKSNKIALTPAIEGVCLEDNLIYKAAVKLREQALKDNKPTTLCGVHIELEKKLPMGGGLGGGSSNAATTLLALNKLWQLDYSPEQLAGIGISLGADVPVFVLGHSAYAEGVGEQLRPVNLPETWYLVVHPGCHVSTANVFSNKQLTRDTPKSKIAPALEGDLGNIAKYCDLTSNDCESVVCQLYPEIRQAINWLSQFSPAKLTGTGACIFASFSDKQRADNVLSQLPTNYQGFVAKGINKSPAIKGL
ncbi:4-(cytidine 5'-diphospho)-2-C-methyl-D-erythritol kinase [Hahella ganghwensis]|uniref:4-(cytidine 5'-diphospho)-2-C-methyl-D-erythritol kinase n=1 Tax=Hahella ganghwensis TaxID=286420 RepID=UPI0003785768|nr:4-(cytidine 5'-diphospho)-2-C-methyl-D-erythritol kinase [Hahella ganghwensis]